MLKSVIFQSKINKVDENKYVFKPSIIRDFIRKLDNTVEDKNKCFLNNE